VGKINTLAKMKGEKKKTPRRGREEDFWCVGRGKSPAVGKEITVTGKEGENRKKETTYDSTRVKWNFGPMVGKGIKQRKKSGGEQKGGARR